MLGALVRRPSRRMKWESEKHEAANFLAMATRLAPAKSSGRRNDLPPANKGVLSQSCGFRYGGAHGGMGDFRGIRAFRSSFHVGKLITQRGDAALRKSVRDGRHERVRDACSGAARARSRRARWAALVTGPRRAGRRRCRSTRTSTMSTFMRGSIEPCEGLRIGRRGRFMHEVHVRFPATRWP